MFSPMYIRDVLQYSVHHTGFAAALPVLIQFFVKVRWLICERLVAAPTQRLFEGVRRTQQ